MAARQRFLWPGIWSDPTFGRLAPLEQVFFIGLFSNADDEGRLLADPAYLRSAIFPLKDLTAKKVREVRNAVTEVFPSVVLYEADGDEYIALLKWKDYQHPKYPKASTLPEPYLNGSSPPENDSSKDGGRVPPRAGQGLGRDGFKGSSRKDGRRAKAAKPGTADYAEIETEVNRIIEHLVDTDLGSKGVLMSVAVRATMSALGKVRESVEKKPGLGVGYAVNAIKDEIGEKG